MKQPINHKGKYYIQSEDGYREVLLSSDPKLIADGVPALPEKAIDSIDLAPPNGLWDEYEVTFLSEFVSRYNNRNVKGVNQDAIQIPLQKYIDEHKNQDECSGFIDGFRACELQSNAGGFSLEDMRNFGKFLRKNFYTNIGTPDKWIYDDEKVHEYLTTEEACERFIQSLPKEKSKGVHYPNIGEDPEYYQPKELEMYCELEEYEYSDRASDSISHDNINYGTRIKLINGQPTLTFK